MLRGCVPTETTVSVGKLGQNAPVPYLPVSHPLYARLGSAVCSSCLLSNPAWVVDCLPLNPNPTPTLAALNVFCIELELSDTGDPHLLSQEVLSL